MAERGNIFILILAGIALFAALSLTALRSTNTKTTSLLTRKQAELAGSEILNYSQNVARGVARLQANDCSENEISFDPPPFDGSTIYNNADAPADFSCHVFYPSSGGVTYKTFPEEYRGAGTGGVEPVFNGSGCIPAVGTGDDGDCTGNGDPSDSDLMIIVSGIKDSICTEINRALGRSALSNTASIIFDETPFTGTFQDIKDAATSTTDLENNYTGIERACIVDASPDLRTYYKVLLAR